MDVTVAVGEIPSCPLAPFAPGCPLRLENAKLKLLANAVPPAVIVTEGMPAVFVIVAVAPVMLADCPFVPLVPFVPFLPLGIV